MPAFARSICIVMDSAGIGELPDADRYGDRGSNTIGNIARRVPLNIPTLRALGLERLVPLKKASASSARSAVKKVSPKAGPSSPASPAGRTPPP